MNLPLRAAAVVLLLGVALSAGAEESLDLSRYRGRVVVVDFWASWCAPCRRSFPWLNQIQSRYAHRGLVVIGVNVDAERAQAEHFLRDVPAQFRIVYDSAGSIAQAFDVPGMPSSLIFGPDGRLLKTHVGFKDSQRDEREAELVELLNQSGGEPRR